MGTYFVMSSHFNKISAADFGLIYSDINNAINPVDDSKWVKTELFDFGWGKENGFYKFPLPGFDALIDLVLNSTDKEDIYGAAAIILEKHPDELLCKCETVMKDSSKRSEFVKLINIFNLKKTTNRSTIAQKTIDQIQSDYARWSKISEVAKKVEQEDKYRGWFSVLRKTPK